MENDKLVEIDHVKDFISREAALASDLIYREDAKVFVRHACYKKINPIDYLDEVPAADVVEVVRCKDCKFFYDGPDQKCCINHKGVVVTDENGFCHHAERRGEDGDQI